MLDVQTSTLSWGNFRLHGFLLQLELKCSYRFNAISLMV